MDLLPKQKVAANHAYSIGDAHGLICDCGTGKTIIELSLINYRIINKQITSCLVIAPYTILWQAWEKDIKKFYPHLTYEIFWDEDMDIRRSMIKTFDRNIGIINYDAFNKCYKHILQRRFDMVVLDESTRIKNHVSSISKKILSLGSYTKYKSILTATPGSKPEHYWSQLRFIDATEKKFKDWREYFCYEIKLGHTGLSTWKPRVERMPVLKDIINRKCVRLSKEGLGLPEKIFIVRDVILPKPARVLYEKMRKDNIVEIDNEKILAEFPPVKSQKLRQMADGILINHENHNVHYVHDEKRNELDVLLDNIDSPVIIWANYVNDIEYIINKYNTLSAYSGTKNKNQDIEDFINGKNPRIACHPRSMGHGVTAINAHIQIYFSLPDFELYMQTQDRTHRYGQTKDCTYYIIKTKNTVDDIIWNRLEKEEDFQQDLIGI